MPSGITVDDKLHEGERFVSYQWEKPRTKGGPRKGLLTIIQAKDGKVRAFTDYNGKSRAEVEILEYEPGKIFRGHFDNFMSYTEFNLKLAREQFAEGSYQLIGNVRWPTTGKLVASSAQKGTSIPEPTGGYPAELNEQEQELILGGEITVWGENINSMTMENRIWPRSYAIAERFWSNEELTDEASMYKRMRAIDNWSEISLGMRHHADARVMMQRLANGSDITPLLALAKYTEPAQYYARNWEKWIQTENPGDLYNQHERLNRFADALPVESYTVYEMRDLVTQYVNGDKSALTSLKHHYEQLLNASSEAAMVFANNVASVDTVALAKASQNIAELGLTLVTKAEAGEKVSSADAREYQSMINDSAKIIDESIVATVKPTEMLLWSLSK
jgi:hexosaminidase